MAGLFSPPSPPAPPPLAALEDADREEARRRLDALARRRRGRAGTIATSARGISPVTASLLADGSAGLRRKSLLGE